MASPQKQFKALIPADLHYHLKTTAVLKNVTMRKLFLAWSKDWLKRVGSPMPKHLPELKLNSVESRTGSRGGRAPSKTGAGEVGVGVVKIQNRRIKN